MEPLISLRLRDQGRTYYPGEELECEYQFDAVSAEEIQAAEASVLWYTEGKGDEDLAVHYFERRAPADVEDGDLRPLRRFRTVLPNSPLSYSGLNVQIRWCVRVRLFLRRGREYFFEQPFQLGDVAPPEVAELTSARDTSARDTSARGHAARGTSIRGNGARDTSARGGNDARGNGARGGPSEEADADAE